MDFTFLYHHSTGGFCCVQQSVCLGRSLFIFPNSDASLLALFALGTWDKYPLSCRRVRFGWLSTILLPFILSFVPLRLVVGCVCTTNSRGEARGYLRLARG